MASYSIFSDTLADLTWPEVAEAGRLHTPLLVPVAVIEQHGLHLPLATDTYAAHLQCTLIKRNLADLGVAAVVAPPYYFGVNASTGMFPGSLSVKTETMVAALTETLEEYARWGFTRQFVVNHHGDGGHVRSVVKSIRNLRTAGIEATLLVGGQALDWAGPALTVAVGEGSSSSGGESAPSGGAILRVPPSEATLAARARLTRSALDVHAGERETSLIMRFFPETLAAGVDIASLEAVPDTLQAFVKAESSGGWRDLSPKGHIGDPAAATAENGELYELEAIDMAAAVADVMRGSL